VPKQALGKRRLTGFTLLEIIMVIALIAILATLAVPSQLAQITQKKLIETLDLVERYKAPIEFYYASHAGRFPSDNAAAGLPAPDQIVGNYLQKMEVRDGVLHLYLGKKLPDNLHNQIISIRPVYVEGSVSSPVSWICGYDEKPDGMVAAGANLTSVEKIFLPGRCR
jgi:type IV pilus assembly protein PilA